jgi:hypothetical protein
MTFLDGPPRTDPTTHQRGDRVKLSELGKSRSPNAVAELGVVTAVPKHKRSVWYASMQQVLNAHPHVVHRTRVTN